MTVTFDTLNHGPWRAALRDAMRDALTESLGDEDVYVRFLPGYRGGISPLPDPDFRADGWALTEGNDEAYDAATRRVSIVSLGSTRSRPGYRNVSYLPSFFFHEESERRNEELLCHYPDWVSGTGFDEGQTFAWHIDDMLVGEIGVNAVYCYFNTAELDDVYNRYGSNHLDLSWLADAIKRATSPELANEIAERMREQVIPNAIQAILDAPNSQLEGLRNSVTTYESTLNNLDRQRASTLTTLRTLREQVQSVMASIDTEALEARLKEQIDKLYAHPRVESIRFSGSKMYVTTDPITMHHPDFGTDRYLGHCEVTFDFTEASPSGVQIRNLDTFRAGRSHPHIPNTAPCWGDSYYVLNDILDSRDYEAAFEFCIQFCEEVNPADEWGAYASYWWEQPDATPAEQPAESNA